MENGNLTVERLRDLLDYDEKTGVFIWKAARRGRAKRGSEAGTTNGCGYTQICVDGKTYLAHRLAWFYVYAVWPKGGIDHKNGIRSANWIKNLRDATTFINLQNQREAHSRNKTGLLGVSPYRKKWRADIFVNNKPKYLGLFSTPMSAHEAYLAAKREYHPGCTI